MLGMRFRDLTGLTGLTGGGVRVQTRHLSTMEPGPDLLHFYDVSRRRSASGEGMRMIPAYYDNTITHICTLLHR